MMKKVVFLDRDGTINVDHGYVNEAAQWEWAEKAKEALKKIQEKGYELVVVTNQSGIAYGLYTLEEMEKLHEYMKKELDKAQIVLSYIAYCPHDRSGQCDCRKPKTGMAKMAEKELGEIDYRQSWTIGDKVSDMMFGKNLGTKTALIRSRYWQEDDLNDKPDLMTESLWKFSNLL